MQKWEVGTLLTRWHVDTHCTKLTNSGEAKPVSVRKTNSCKICLFCQINNKQGRGYEHLVIVFYCLEQSLKDALGIIE